MRIDIFLYMYKCRKNGVILIKTQNWINLFYLPQFLNHFNEHRMSGI